MINTRYTIEACSSLKDCDDNTLAVFDGVDKNLFYSSAWFQNYENTIIPDGKGELVYVVREGTNEKEYGEAVAIHLMKTERESTALFGYNKVTSLANYYSTYHNVLIKEGIDYEPVLEVLVDEFEKNKEKYSAFNLGPVVEGDKIALLLENEFRRKGWFTYFYKMFGNWILHVNDQSFEEYYQTVPSKVRNTIKRKEKKLIKEHDTSYKLYTDSDEVETAISEFNEVYNSSWKAKEPYPEFIGGLIRTCAENKWLRLAVMQVDNKPVAAQLWIVKDAVAYIYKLAYTEDSKKLSAGSIVTRNMMQHVIDSDRVKIIDYLTGDDAYKKDWMTERRQMVGLMAYSNTYKGNILTFAYRFKKLMKKLINKPDE